ncbi:LytTR family transcriptional regulator DNA-binding domain-containing protein [Desulfosporosinus lacus]|uniref:Stage 0 sporulation protein A homolog n=1 Tax=Desulfosporosinus lacus DSM 15449 TaxID=1121420 RepID=A0A1M5ZU55_9FIRM|nr:LytTR family transcriptional regulator DNA-binding domain-containing protein [Desulfosporosinus lacus]SHI27742.1 two component transcriptional regulator, LytTR family [Desulfosporosinus lacus DSM 15449]
MGLEANILLIDDEASVIRALRRVFQQEAYNLLSAENPEDALTLIQKNEIDLIICDHQMPGMSGIELLTHAKRISPDTIRILITGSNDINVAISAINEGSIYYYIAKPWENEEVKTVVKKALTWKQEQKEKENIQQILNFSKNCLLDVSEKLNAINHFLPGEDQNEQTGTKCKPEPGMGKIPVNEEDNIIIIEITDIIYLSAESGDVTVVASTGRYISHDSLNLWEQRLAGYNFFRCHRSFIVNVDQIAKITPWFNGAYTITPKNLKENIPVSRNSIKQLKKIFAF